MRKNNLDTLGNELDRIITLIQFSDQKNGFLLLIYPILVGFIINNLNAFLLSIEQLVSFYSKFAYSLLLTIVLIQLVLGLLFLFLSVLPNLKNKNKSDSPLFFSSISKMKFEDFLLKRENLTEKEWEQLLLEQIYTNSCLLEKKMNNVKKSFICLFTLSIAISFLYILLVN